MRKTFIHILIFLITINTSCSIKEIIDLHMNMVEECLKNYDYQKRENCIYGTFDNLKLSINQYLEKNKNLNIKLFYVGFVRFEGENVLGYNELFKVEKDGKYFVTILNTTPKYREKVKTISLHLWSDDDDKTIYKNSEFNHKAYDTITVELKKGVEYLFIVETLQPKGSFITILLTDKPIF